MANFKGGFAFNNGPAKVEVEQAPDGTLVSCVNPVTGESLGGGVGEVVFEGEMSITKATNLWEYLSPIDMQPQDVYVIFIKDLTVAGRTMDYTENAAYALIFTAYIAAQVYSAIYNVKDSNDDHDYNIFIDTTINTQTVVIMPETTSLTLSATITKIIKIAA